MKTLLLVFFLSIFSSYIFAQTPIDALQKSNTNYLEKQEQKGYEFRSQIITEFNFENATQDVNISLNDAYNYLIVAMGDANIPAVDLSIKPDKNVEMKQSPDVDEALKTRAYELKPAKAGRYKISINVTGFGESDSGFVSFMVLRN